MPLKVIIVGAGIAGLCAAASLRQAGHDVEIFEKSRFASEIGAALALTPNGARVLSHLGFSFSKARAVQIDAWNTVHGDTMARISSIDLSISEKVFGFPSWAVHRVDLHNELLRLATSESEAGKPVQIHLASEVVRATSTGSIVLEDGSQHNADLIVAADGLHSVLKGIVLGDTETAPAATNLSAFRFLIDTEVLKQDEKLAAVLTKKGPGATMLVDMKEITSERHIMWYPCRGGTVQNFVGIHPTRKEDLDDDADAMKDSMLQEFGHFDPDVVEIIKKSSHVRCWPLFNRNPLSTWVKDRILLVGDAAHPMLPFGGQGANQAIEDGGALGCLLKGIENPADIPHRLHLFERVRKPRASRVQILSKVRAGREKEVEEEVKLYAEPLDSAVPTDMQGRTMHDYRFDVFAKCNEVLQSAK